LKALRDGLQDVGYTEGRNIRLEIRSAEGRADLLSERAADLVRLKVDVMVAFQTPPATAARQATHEIPIVMAGVGDPIGTGLVASLARPGGNVTGMSAGRAELAGKTVELIREVLPSIRRLAVLANEVDPFTTPYLAQLRAAARHIGVEMEPVMVRPSDPLAAAFETIIAKRADAVFIQGSLVRKEAELAMKHRLPSLATASLARAGAMLSHAANFGELHRQTAVYVDRILKGAKPADLPVAFPTKFELIINLKTARAIGLDISPVLLARAGEVIE
jgi:putative ABC transport system substrate-binding protein